MAKGGEEAAGRGSWERTGERNYGREGALVACREGRQATGRMPLSGSSSQGELNWGPGMITKKEKY